jgi:SRSO17 transposase
MPSRLPRVPRTPLPELAEFLAPLTVHFAQRPSAAVLERYVSGLLTECPHKNCDTLAQVVPGTNEQQLHHLLTDMAWDEQDLNAQRIQQMLTLPTEGDAVLVLDDTGFPKQGHASAGVQRQYSGTLGKTGNCQVAVTCHYAERTLAWPLDARLYLPERWATDPERRSRAHVPEAVAFQTKPAIALELLDAARALGVPHRCVTVDADYGDKPPFLNALEARAERYVVAVASSFTVARSRRGPPTTADAVLRQEAPSAWVTLSWREGSRGRERAKVRALRGWRVDADGTRHAGWLLGQRPARAQRGDPKWRYFWSNCPVSTPLDQLLEYAHRRWWIEQYHAEAKQLLGWDEFQGRRYDAFHRHTVAVMTSYSFLVWLEWHERQRSRRRGRRRHAFSPSTGSAAAPPAAGPSRGGRLAAPRRTPDAHPHLAITPHLSALTMTKPY